MTPQQIIEFRRKKKWLLAKAMAYKSGKDGRDIMLVKETGAVMLKDGTPLTEGGELVGKAPFVKAISRLPECAIATRHDKGGEKPLFSGIYNRTIFTGDENAEADNLAVLQRMDSEVVDLIYLDPPFNSKQDYLAPVGSLADELGAFFTDTFARDDRWAGLQEILLNNNKAIYAVIKAAEAANDKSAASYLTFMAVRLLEMHRILKPTGSIYLHCDPTMSHYLKMLMGGIFGKGNFRNEIVWAYTGPGSPKMRQFNRKHDNVIWYSKSDQWTFNGDQVRIPYKDPKQTLRRVFDTGKGIGKDEVEKYRKRGKVPETWWSDIALAVRGKENTKYPTQKPVKLLTRIISASSNKGDIVLDPFCGCGTACDAAERLGRKWIGIDAAISAGAVMIELREKGQGGLEEKRALVNWRMVGGEAAMPKRRDSGNVAVDYVPPKPSVKRLTQNAKQAFKILACDNGGGQCWVCGKKDHADNFEVDHKVAFSISKDNSRENLLLLCKSCNSSKGKKSMDEFLVYCDNTERALSFEARRRLKEVQRQRKLT